MNEKAAKYREMLLETVAETDEDLLEKHFGGEDLTVAEIKAAIRKMTDRGEIYPVLCGSAFKNRGVQPMLDAVVDYLPRRSTCRPSRPRRRARRDRHRASLRREGAVQRLSRSRS